MSILQSSFPNTHALVLCGGRSFRMGTDKSMLVYYTKPQRYHVYDLLQPFCERVFISCKHSVVESIEAGYLCLTDNHLYNNIGPMAALLTAFETFPGKNILLIGCDYPLLNGVELNAFSLHCKGDYPVSFYNKNEDMYEPVLAWYPHHLAVVVQQKFQEGRYSLRHFLSGINAVKYFPENSNSILSVDTNEAFTKVQQSIPSS